MTEKYSSNIHTVIPYGSPIMLKLFEEYLGILLEGNSIENSDVNQRTQICLLDLCHELCYESLTLTDVCALPNHILNSVLGNSDGQNYGAVNKVIHSDKQTYIIPS